jgi:gluconolactonase
MIDAWRATRGGSLMEMRFVAENLNFPGGLLILPGGDVLVAEVSGAVLTRISADGTRSEFARTGGAPMAAAFGPDGAIYVCNNGAPRAVREKLPDGRTAYRPPRPGEVPAGSGGQIQRVGMNGELSTIHRACEGRPLMAPANLVFDRQGNFYFSDMGIFEGPVRDPGVSTESKHLSVLRMAGAIARHPAGSIYYASPDGRLIREILHPMAAPNGVALSPDETTLYVGESGTGRVWAFQVPAPGQVGKRRCLGVVPGRRPLNFSWCEGLAVDALGDVLAATVVNGGITTFSPHGGEIEHVATGDPLTGNVCFGGADGRTLFVTLSGSGRLVAYDAWPTAGHKLNFAT